MRAYFIALLCALAIHCCAECEKPDVKKVTAQSEHDAFDVSLVGQLAFFKAILTDKTDVTEAGKHKAGQALYALTFSYWMWAYGPEPCIQPMKLFEKNFHDWGKLLLNNPDNNNDPWVIGKFYEHGSIPEGSFFIPSDWLVDLKRYRKWDDYQRYVALFQKTFLKAGQSK